METETSPEATGLPGLTLLTTPTNPRNTSKILFSKDSIIIGQQGWTLPLSELG
ncbi:hypothetical protein Hanom_Chr12g01097501 [Helianthus anomalus]